MIHTKYILLKIMVLVYILVIIRSSDLNVLPLPFKIHQNAINYDSGLLRIIGKDDSNVYVGGRSMVFRIPFDSNSKLQLLLKWKSIISAQCKKGADIYVQYIQEPSWMNTVLEVCGSSRCHHICRSYDVKKKKFVQIQNGLYMVPRDIHSTTRHLVEDRDIIVAIDADDHQEGYIARHFNRTFIHSQKDPVMKSILHSFSDNVKFLNIFSRHNKTYFIFTEFPSETTNFYHIFRNSQTPKIRYTRLGRICNNDTGLRVTQLSSKSFLKATLSCQITMEMAENRKWYIEYNDGIAATLSVEDPDLFTVLFRSTEPLGTGNEFSSAICQYSLRHIELQLSKTRLAYLSTKNTPYWTSDRFKRDVSKCNNQIGDRHPNTEHMVTDLLKPIAPPLIIYANKNLGNPTSIDILESTSVTVLMEDKRIINITFDMVYIATDNGVVARNIFVNQNIKKIFSSNTFNYQKRLQGAVTVMTFDHFTKVSDNGGKISSLVINKEENSLIVVGDSFVKRLPLEFCTNNCRSCNTNIDPFCQWNTITEACEVKSQKRWNGMIKIYECTSGRMEKSLNIPLDIKQDFFWIVFSVIMFLSIFCLVLTVSLVLKHNSSNTSLFQMHRRSNHSKQYQTVRNKSANPSLGRKKDRMLCTFSSSISTVKSLHQATIQKSKLSEQGTLYNPHSDSIVIENKNKDVCSEKRPSMKLDFDEERFSTENLGHRTILTSWKSCDAVLDLLKHHHTYGKCIHNIK